LAQSTLGVEGRARILGWGLRRVTSINYSHGPAQTKQQVGQCIIRALLVLRRAMGKLKFTRFTTT